MSTFRFSKAIRASREEVFRSVSEIDQFSKAIPHIVEIRYLTETRRGPGTRFEETRLYGGRRATSILEVTELVEPERIRLISEAGGTVWDSTFTVRSDGDLTHLTLTMEARPKNLMARVMGLFIKRMIQKAIEDDMESIKAFCEEGSGSSSNGASGSGGTW